MRKIQNLNGVWDFHFSETAKTELLPDGNLFNDVAVIPGCFDVLPPYYGKRGTGFYRRKIYAGGLNALNIDGLGIEAAVYWDGVKIGSCPYAYMPEKFIFNAGAYGEHELLIAVSNHFNDVFFSFYDFYAYGGIFGSVTLEELSDNFISSVHIETLDFKTRMVKITVNTNRFRRKAIPLTMTFDNRIIKTEMFHGKTMSFQYTLDDFSLWSTDDPAMHKLRISLDKDEIEENFGIRQIYADGKKVLLNGKEIVFKGFNRHESHVQFGAATPASLMAADLQQMKSIGCNFVRGSHYSQRKEFLDLCDKMGILVWEEALGWDVKPPYLFSRQFLNIQLEQLRKMVAVHFNHPSIVIWGFLNETESQLQRTRNIISRLYAEIRKYDTSRLITFASNKYEKDCCTDLVDVVAMNPYPGWYDPDWENNSGINNVIPVLEKLTSAMPENKPLMISEIGAAAFYGYHDSYNSRWTEEYQADLAEEVCRYVLDNPQFCGLIFWHFCDAKSYINGNILGRPRGFNNKGFLDEYRRPKLAWAKAAEWFKKIQK